MISSTGPAVAARRAPSIRRRLTAWLFAGLTLTIVVATLATYLRARDEASALFDVQLEQTAASITGLPLGRALGAAGAGREGLVVQIWDRTGVRVYLPQPKPDAVPDRLPRQAPGFATLDAPDGPWRVFSVIAGGQLVQVAQPLAVRDELAASLALSTIVPLLAAAPILLVVAWFAIGRGLAPVHRLADAVAKRTPTQLAPLSERGWPREVQPLVDALNALLGRLDHALDAQRAFVADAAHELRTPLAALQLQAQLAGRAADPDERSRALGELRQGLARATRMVEQLLALARAEPGVADRPTTAVDVAALAREVVASLSPIAAAKRIDLGVARADIAVVAGDPEGLRSLVANLVDNALRYTAEGGRVDVTVELDVDGASLAVRDDGPGIPVADRERVFTRFARGDAGDAPGSGLGLAIVRSVAERHRAVVSLDDGLGGRGLSVVVRFPPDALLARPSPAAAKVADDAPRAAS